VPVSPWWPTLTLVWVCVQGAFGALTVTMKLFPAIVTLHLLGGLALLAPAVRAGRALCAGLARNHARAAVEPHALAAGLATFAAGLVQVALGGWVSTNYAVLACNEFPQCQGSWWPYMDFPQGFTLWRELGKTPRASTSALARSRPSTTRTAGMAYGRVGAAGPAGLALAPRACLRAQARWLAGLAAVAVATGLSNVVLDWPLVAAVSHTGGAAALVVVLTWALCGQSRRDGYCHPLPPQRIEPVA
jgi:cytochrome c oxidase assembly protein subunit 15